jgi:predicted nucleic acid-binding protein
LGATALSPTLLIDNSAWARLQSGSVPDARASEIADRLDAGDVAICLPFILEAGYSARGFVDHDTLYDGLVAFSHLLIDKRAERRSLDAQAQLARAGHHRMPPVDLIVAGLADRYEVGILHYDADFDLVLEKTDLDFHSEWLMPRGSLN